MGFGADLGQPRKKADHAAQLLPDIALLDAPLTLVMPRAITAATAPDAMAHTIEAATSRTRKSPISDGLADKALVLLGQSLPIVLDGPTDLAARVAMLLGATRAGMDSINASVGAIHAKSYPPGSGFHVPHGHANALVAGPVLRFKLRVTEACIPGMASEVVTGISHLLATNPRDMTEMDVTALYREVL